jgi:hypothetical protein
MKNIRFVVLTVLLALTAFNAIFAQTTTAPTVEQQVITFLKIISGFVAFGAVAVTIFQLVAGAANEVGKG